MILVIYGEWESWEPCITNDGICGAGVRERARQCFPGSNCIDGVSRETEDCEVECGKSKQYNKYIGEIIQFQDNMNGPNGVLVQLVILVQELENNLVPSQTNVKDHQHLLSLVAVTLLVVR